MAYDYYFAAAGVFLTGGGKFRAGNERSCGGLRGSCGAGRNKSLKSEVRGHGGPRQRECVVSGQRRERFFRRQPVMLYCNL